MGVARLPEVIRDFVLFPRFRSDFLRAFAARFTRNLPPGLNLVCAAAMPAQSILRTNAMTPAWALFFLDLVAVSVGWPAALWIAGVDWRQSWLQILVFPLIHLLCFYALGLYRRES